MSKIKELIERLCPDGVEYLSLQSITINHDRYRRPVTKKDRLPGIYPYYGANGIQDYVDNYIFDGVFLLIGEDGSVINKYGSPILKWAKGKIWVNNHAHVLSEKDGVAQLRYIFYALQVTDVSTLVRGTPPKLNQDNLNNIMIPVPPLEAQQEIVRILDTFTTLEAELEAELEARKKQYEYYRRLIVNYPSKADNLVEFLFDGVTIESQLLRLEDVLKNGNAPNRVMKSEYKDKGEFPIIDQSKSNISGYTDDESAVQYTFPCIVFGDHTRVVKFVDHIFAQGDSGTKVFISASNRYNLKYIYYVLSSIDIKSRGYNRHWSYVKDIEILVPPIEVQNRIVSILDNFEILVRNISQGLPAEIASRRKQYEYYRNKLLTFKELSL